MKKYTKEIEKIIKSENKFKLKEYLNNKDKLNEIDSKEGIYIVFTNNKVSDKCICSSYVCDTLVDKCKKGKIPKPYSKDRLVEKMKYNSKNTILYVGQSSNMRKRIRQYLSFLFDTGKTHKGGRAIGQIINFCDLYIAWHECQGALEIEKTILNEFKKINNVYPFANWRM